MSEETLRPLVVMETQSVMLEHRIFAMNGARGYAIVASSEENLLSDCEQLQRLYGIEFKTARNARVTPIIFDINAFYNSTHGVYIAFINDWQAEADFYKTIQESPHPCHIVNNFAQAKQKLAELAMSRHGISPGDEGRGPC